MHHLILGKALSSQGKKGIEGEIAQQPESQHNRQCTVEESRGGEKRQGRFFPSEPVRQASHAGIEQQRQSQHQQQIVAGCLPQFAV